jgi:putative FmdB family regulatory protein
MPIYEYRATGKAYCNLCKDKFEVRQGMNDEPLKSCPKCGSEVSRLFSPPFLWRKGSPSEEESFAPQRGEEADELGLDEGFGEDEEWE